MIDPKSGSNEAGIARADSEASSQALQELGVVVTLNMLNAQH